MFVKADNLLSRAIIKNGLSRQVEAVRICDFWEKAIKEKFSDDASRKSKAIYFNNKTLVVAVLSSVWAQEFQLHQYEIIKEINKRMGKVVVERVRFEV